MRARPPPMFIGMPPSRGENPIRTREYTHNDAMRDMEMRRYRDANRIYRPSPFEHNNTAARDFVGHPRFGFHTMLNHDSFGKLPTAPAIVGGNVNWMNSKVSPVTQSLHNVLSAVRPMNPIPAMGSALRMGEPNVNSIHTQY
jgi:hypothetical protein